ncbi:hypothetical protein C7S15_7767 [Burkholderia cepacia]|nr:hypothetical protein [Burkholderia cepacia]
MDGLLAILEMRLLCTAPRRLRKLSRALELQRANQFDEIDGD